MLVVIIFVFILSMIGFINIFIMLLFKTFIIVGMRKDIMIRNIEVLINMFPICFRSFVDVNSIMKSIIVMAINMILLLVLNICLRLIIVVHFSNLLCLFGILYLLYNRYFLLYILWLLLYHYQLMDNLYLLLLLLYNLLLRLLFVL